MARHVIRNAGGEQLQVELDAAPATAALNAAITSTGATTTGAASSIQGSGVITTPSLTLAHGAVQTLTLTNAKCTANSVVLASIGGGTNTTVPVRLQTITPAAGSVAIVIGNDHASAALNGTLTIAYAILN